MARIARKEGKVSKTPKHSIEEVFTTPFTEVRMVAHFPDENPPKAVEDITRVLAHLEVFADLKTDVPT